MKYRFAPLTLSCFVALVVIGLSASQTSYSQTTKSGTALSSSEQELLSEINQVRANPQVYASYLEQLKPMFKGKQYLRGGQHALETQEGWTAVEDAIKFLRAAKPLRPLTASQGLSLAALAHVKDQSSSGSTGHRGTNSMMIEERVKPYGMWQGGIGENLTYGDDSARERVLTWLIDDGFATRGHRNRLMSDGYKVAGISCGPHPEYRSMCVVTLAGGFSDLSVNAGTEKTVKPKTAGPRVTTSPAPSGNQTAKPVTNSSKPKARQM